MLNSDYFKKMVATTITLATLVFSCTLLMAKESHVTVAEKEMSYDFYFSEKQAETFKNIRSIHGKYELSAMDLCVHTVDGHSFTQRVPAGQKPASKFDDLKLVASNIHEASLSTKIIYSRCND